MLDLSDDEELQRLREAALKSKRKPGIQDKIEDVNHEVKENKVSQVQPVPPVFTPFYGPPPSLQQNQPPLMIPLAMSQPIPPSQLNSLHFPAYHHHFMTHSQGTILNHLAPIRPRIHPINSKKLDFGQTASPGYKSSNLIVITGNETDNSSLDSKHQTDFSSDQSEKRKSSPKAEKLDINFPKVRRNNDNDQSNFGREEKVKISKFERYKSDESSDDEETYMSQSDGGDSQKSNDESEDHFEVEEANDKVDVDDNRNIKTKSSSSSSSKSHESEDHNQDAKNITSSDEWTSEENVSVENECHKPQFSSKSSEVSSKSSNRRCLFSFSDDVEDFHLDIPDENVIQVSIIDSCKHEEEINSQASVVKHQKHLTRKRSPHHFRTSSDKEQKTLSMTREKLFNKNPEKRVPKSSRTMRHSSRSRPTKSLANKIDSGVSTLRKTERARDSPKRQPATIKRKYNTREDYYERSPESLRERVYRKTRYCDEREMPEYVNDYRDYQRGFSHHQRSYEKSDSYVLRDIDDHYLYGDERRGHDDYMERSHDNYYRVYLEPHRSGDDHYRYQSPLPKRYRGIERDHYGESSDRDAVRLELGRRYEEDHYINRINSNKRYSNVNAIPSLLEGIYIDKRYATEGLRDKFRPLLRSETRENTKLIEGASRVKEGHENSGKIKKSSDNFRSKDEKKCFGNKEHVERKPSRRVIETHNGFSYSNQNSDNGARSRNLDQSDTNPKTSNDKKSLSGSSSQDKNGVERTFDKRSIHNRLGSKPEKRNAVSCKVGYPAVVSA